MSAVTPWTRSGLTVALKAIFDESGDQEKPPTLNVLPLGARRAGGRRLEGLGHVDGPEVGVVVLLADDDEVAEVLLAVLRRVLVRGGGGEGDGLAVGRPGEVVDAGLGLGQLHRLAAVRGDGEDLALVAGAVAGEREPAAVGRPGRVAGGLLAAGELHASGRWRRRPARGG